jgi:molybdopterin converting factor subunit 1
MRVRVLLFARAKDLAGTGSLTLELPEGATVAGLRHLLAATYPRLAQFLPRCAVAVGSEIASDEVTLAEDAEVALLPPVSGG